MDNVTYVVFLRGINVGGNTLLKMAQLKKGLESLGFKSVVPVLASGNVVFETPEEGSMVLKRRIEGMLAKNFSIQVVAILRTASEILGLIKANPFGRAQLSSDSKLQVTFLSQENNTDKKFPVELTSKDFKIAQVSKAEVVSVVDLSTNARTPELMKLLEKQFGKNITTRTWNTLEKVAKIIAKKTPLLAERAERRSSSSKNREGHHRRNLSPPD